MMREISSLIYNASEDQIIRARNQLKASILFSQDGPGGALAPTSMPQKPECRSNSLPQRAPAHPPFGIEEASSYSFLGLPVPY